MNSFFGLLLSIVAALTLTPKEKNVSVMRDNMPTDSLLVIVDGVAYKKLIENTQLSAFELAVNSIPYISPEDIESAELITRDQFIEKGSILHAQSSLLLIQTKRERAIKDFYVNGKPVHRKKGIELGCLLDRKVLLRQIEKVWHINPKKIKSLEVDEKRIIITTK